jgi:hypothetical protein
MTNTPAKSGATGAYSPSNKVTSLRRQMKYKVNTGSTTSKGITYIKGATKHPAQPDIYFTREAWVKQCHLVDKCTKEVGWFAMVDHDEKANTFTITEIVIPNQEVTAAETDIGKEDLADAAMELIEAGKDTSKLYAWFHSHVNMTVTPSGQDEYQVEDFLEDLADQPEVPAFIRGIQNKAGDLKLDVYYIQHGVAYQNCDFYVIHDDDPQWALDIEAEIRTKVSERKTFHGYNQGGSYGTSKNSDSANLAGVQNGFRSGYNGYGGYGGYDDFEYDDHYDGYVKYTPVAFDEDDDDDTNAPMEALEKLGDTFEQQRWWNMDIVYQSPSGIEVMQEKDGSLVVCDVDGTLYDYDQYVACYGEIDGDVAQAKPNNKALATT